MGSVLNIFSTNYKQKQKINTIEDTSSVNSAFQVFLLSLKYIFWYAKEM